MNRSTWPLFSRRSFLQGTGVTCPWHAWRFDLKDGTWCDNRRLKVNAYEVKVENGDIYVGIKPNNASDPKTDES